ncbi:PPOX class F420-dependent oxidoreductase [Saccharopolyspora cebuensis]|uniref:PPOX class F420-dependent oxidoreductase n=1 Tax=Saccharopolyspora cebuensis TaxID=418759 RepID=A0ABV4CI32_9PSEU
MSRRDRITMTQAEIDGFIAARRVVVLATVKPGGRPHLVPMWFVPDGPRIEVWSFGKSQKTVNLRRDPRATLLLEAGESYDQLRGVSLECSVEVLDDPAEVRRIGAGLARRYAGAREREDPEELRERAAKRVGLRFTPTRTISWDHRKLADG